MWVVMQVEKQDVDAGKEAVGECGMVNAAVFDVCWQETAGECSVVNAALFNASWWLLLCTVRGVNTDRSWDSLAATVKSSIYAIIDV